MHWRLLIEEFGLESRHIKGRHNLIDDSLSMLELDNSSDSEEYKLEKPTAHCMAALISRSEIFDENYQQHMVLEWLNPLV
jgi:hypothetical protein